MSHKTFIIAEAGVNHNGILELAKKMIDIAVDVGADAIKFQTFKAENMVSVSAVKADYQLRTTDETESQLEMIRRLELDEAAHKELFQYCEVKEIQFLSSPFELESIDLLDRLGLKLFKVPSGEITNHPYLRKIGALKKEIILSTGMADLGEIEDAIDVLTEAGTELKNITVLHCNTEYPTPFEDVNLKAMQTIKSAFPGIHVGYSDHTEGIEVPVAAVAMGATVIEKHFTLDRTLPGPDHRASIESYELREMVRAIRNIEMALGSGIKKPSPSEIKNRVIVRKSIVAKDSIIKGEIFSEGNLTTKRTGKKGLSPTCWDHLLGRCASRDYQKDEMIDP